MAKESRKLFLKIFVVEAESLEQAIKTRGKLAHMLTATEKQADTILESVGIELSRPEWSDYEPDVPEMGYKRPKLPVRRKKR